MADEVSVLSSSRPETYTQTNDVNAMTAKLTLRHGWKFWRDSSGNHLKTEQAFEGQLSRNPGYIENKTLFLEGPCMSKLHPGRADLRIRGC
eukprot:2279451-Amphidinium_carterae.1